MDGYDDLAQNHTRRPWQKMISKLKSLAAISVMDQTLVSGVNFAIGLFLAYRLGIAGFGQYSLILLIVQFCIELQRSAINSPMFVFSAKLDQKEYLATLYPLQMIVSIF